ncbi:MAG: hypothetical protein FJ253_05200 [Phycisphaerae bacterium]|nr:hypothetical protein [Phycisphaerae bacterium]
MAIVVETHPNQVSGSLAWDSISGKIRNGYKVVEVRSKMVDGQRVWEFTCSTADPPTTGGSGGSGNGGG